MKAQTEVAGDAKGGKRKGPSAGAPEVTELVSWSDEWGKGRRQLCSSADWTLLWRKKLCPFQERALVRSWAGHLHWTPHRGSQTAFFGVCPEHFEMIWRSLIYIELQPKARRALTESIRNAKYTKIYISRFVFFLMLTRVSSLNRKIGVVLSPHFRGSWKNVIICEAFRQWSNMYHGKSHREIKHCFEKRSRTRYCKQALWTRFISP